MKLTIYSTSICAACHSLTRWLDNQGISYDIKVIDSNPELMAEFMNINDGHIGVPFSVITGDSAEVTKISGFNHSKFKQVLNL